MKKFRLVLVCAIAVLFFGSCHTYTHSMKGPNANVEYHAEDFNLSEQVTGEATVVRVIGIDWLPNGANYALYNLMKKNPGYDIVIYPQVEAHRHAPVLGTDIYSKTTYKVTARLGKLKK